LSLCLIAQAVFKCRIGGAIEGRLFVTDRFKTVNLLLSADILLRVKVRAATRDACFQGVNKIFKMNVFC